MADIVKLDMTDIPDTQQGIYQAFPNQMELTDYNNNGTVDLASSRVEYLGEFPYRIEGGDIVLTGGGLSDGVVYLIIKEDGDGTATASLTDEVVDDTNWNSDKGGYYINSGPNDGAKVVFKMVKTGASYSSKGRMTGKVVDDRLDNDTERALLYSLIF